MSTSGGQAWPTIDELEAQERDLVLDRADLASLHSLGRLMSKVAAERGLPIVIQHPVGRTPGLRGRAARQHGVQ